MLIAARHAPERFDELFAREPVGPGHVADLIRACAGQGWRRGAFEVVEGEIRPLPTPAVQPMLDAEG
jgi:hypothetical protein